MKRFIRGQCRGQSTPLPDSINDYLADTNLVRVIALVWLMQQPSVIAPIFRASTIKQLDALGRSARLQHSTAVTDKFDLASLASAAV